MAHSFNLQLNIPVADHIHKYLMANCGIMPFLATRTTFIGSVVLSVLNRNEDVRHVQSKRYDQVFNVIIKEESYLRNGVFIDQKCAKVFNDLIDNMFRQELYNHAILNKTNHGTKYLTSIRNFLKTYNITEDDIREDTVHRDFKRKKAQIEERLQLKIPQ